MKQTNPSYKAPLIVEGSKKTADAAYQLAMGADVSTKDSFNNSILERAILDMRNYITTSSIVEQTYADYKRIF